MPLPLETATTVAVVYDRIVTAARTALATAEAVRGSLAAGQNIDQLAALYNSIRTLRQTGITYQATTGLSDYAKQQTGNASYDIVASFSVVITRGDAVTNWLGANVPNDGSGGYVSWRVASGFLQRVTLPSATLTPLGPLLDAFILEVRGS